MNMLIELLASILLVAGGIFAFIGSLGMAHLKDFYMRLHGPTKVSTLGVGCMLIASMVYFLGLHGRLSIQEMLITLFLFITAPVSAHMLSKAGLHMKLERADKTGGNPRELSEEGGDNPAPPPEKDVVPENDSV